MGFAVQTDMVLPPIHLLGQRGAEAALPAAGDRRRADRLPGDHRAGRRLRRRRDPHDRDPRRRRVRDQRLEDVHHQRRPRRLHRAGHEDRPRGRPRRDHPLRRRPARRARRDGPGLLGLARRSRRWECTPPTRPSWRSRTCASRPTPCSARTARASTTSPGSFRESGWSPRRAAYAGCREDVREDPRLRQGARGVRPSDRPLPGRSATSSPTWRPRSRPRSRWCYATAWRFANGEYPVREITMAKLFATRDLPRGRRRVRPDPRRLRLHEGVRDRARLPRRRA